MSAPNRRQGLALLMGAVLALSVTASGAAPPRAYALIVIGLAGDEPHYRKFWELGQTLYRGLRDRCGYSEEAIVFLFQDNPDRHPIIDGRSTRAGIETAFAGLAGRVGPEDKLFVFVAGHADRSGKTVRIHLPGPDLTHEALAALADTVRSRHMTLVVTTPLSGRLIRRVSKPGRICITATDALPEQSETVFPYQFVRGFFDPAADANRDGLLSTLELFRYATEAVKRFYRERHLLATEHALLDDDGDGVGDLDARGEGGDGTAAAGECFELMTGA